MVLHENITLSLSSTQTDQNATVRDIPNVTRNNSYNPQIFQGPNSKTIFNYLKPFFIDVFKSNKKLFLAVANVLVIFLLTVSFGKFFASDCKNESDAHISEGVKVFCNSLSPIDRVIVDIDLNATTHCYSSKSCVVLGEALQKQQGKFRYNFIIGAYGFVYVEHGYKCETEEQDGALYIRLPVDSIYNGQDFMAAQKAVSKFNEILREGLECGKILHNYTITATGCGKFKDWCTHMLQELVTEEYPDRGINVPQTDYFDDTKEGSLFNPLNIKRAYNYKYKLIVCNQNLR